MSGLESTDSKGTAGGWAWLACKSSRVIWRDVLFQKLWLQVMKLEIDQAQTIKGRYWLA